MFFCSNCSPLVLGRALIIPAVVITFQLVPALIPIARSQTADSKARSFRDRVVDKVALKDGTQLWGMAVSEKPPKMLMRTAWLKVSNPDFFTTRIAPELKSAARPKRSLLAERLLKDIEQLQQRNEVSDQQRVGLLMEIYDRLAPDNDTDPDFIIIEFPKSELRKMEMQPAARREYCRLAMLNHIPDLEELDGKSIAGQLRAIPENMRRVAMPVQEENADRDRDRILAAVDVRLNMATRLIQSGETLIDESAKPDPATLVNSMLGGNLQSLLGDLLNESSRPAPGTLAGSTLPESASRLAEAQKRSTVVLSGFEFSIASGSATVTRQLFRKSDDGHWKLVLAARGTSTTAELKSGQIEAIENDPQIKEISGVIEGLGLGNEQFANALRMGAVVRNAMSLAEQSFENDMQRFITTKGLSQTQTTPVIRLAEPDAPVERR